MPPAAENEFLRTEVFNEAMKSIRDQFTSVRESVARIEALQQQASTTRLKDVYEEGVRTGRIQALEGRMDRAESWVKGIAIVLAGCVATWFLTRGGA